MCKIIVVNGAPESGKSTFVDYCIDYLDDRAAWISTVDFPKSIYRELGWNGQKTDEARKWLSDCKDLFSRNDMLWHHTARQIDEMSLWRDAIFVFVREPYEIQKFVDYFDAFTVFLDRDNRGKSYSNHADREVFNYNYDFYIKNDGDLDMLKAAAHEFCREQVRNQW